MTVAAGTAPGDLTIPARLRYQACDETMCYIPTTAETGWSVRVVAAGAPVKRAARRRVRRHRLRSRRGAEPAAPSISAERAASPIVRNETATREAGDPAARLANFTVLGTTGGYMGSADFLQFVRNAENGVQQQGLFEGRGPLAILLIVFLGGLALNLTPCVLPMIPINLAIIGAGQAGSRGRGFLLGAAYGAAMALVYGVLGLIVILTAGTFGTINASPWFNAGIAVLFVVLALAMFDVLVIDFSSSPAGSSSAKPGRGTLLLAFGWAPSPRCWPARASRRSSFRSCCSRATCTRQGRRRRWRCRFSSASAWRCPGRSPAPASRRCPSRAPGWSGSSRPSACSSWRRPPTTATRPTAVREPLGRCRRGRLERRGEAQGRLVLVARRGPRRREARTEAGAHRHVGDLVQELSDDGQDDAGRIRR